MIKFSLRHFFTFAVAIVFIVGLTFVDIVVCDNINMHKIKQCRANLEWCAIERPKLYEAITGEV